MLVLQEVHRVKALFPVDVDQVLEVPTHHQVHLVNDGHRHMVGILGIPNQHHLGRKVMSRQRRGFGGQKQDGIRIGKGVVPLTRWCCG